MAFVTRPFPLGDKWAVRIGNQLRVFVNSREAYEFWEYVSTGRMV